MIKGVNAEEENIIKNILSKYPYQFFSMVQGSKVILLNRPI